MNEPCIVCGDVTRGYAQCWRGLRRCGNCGHCVADLNLQYVDARAIYQRDYFFGGDCMNYLRDRAVFEEHFQTRLREIARYRADGDLIEIGCAYGFFLNCAQTRYRVRGFDLAEEPTAFARATFGVDARSADFTALPDMENSADIVVLWDTIEHLPFPERMLKQAAAALRPGGYLFLTTGDISSVLARITKSRWRMIHPPTHLHYFTRASIAQLLQRVGLTTLKIDYVGVRRSISQVLFGLIALGRNDPPMFYRGLADSRVGRFSFVLNTFDIMLVIAQKCPTP